MLGTFYANVGVVPSPSTLLIRSPQKKPQSPWEVTPRSGSLPVMCTTTQLEADTPPWRLPDALSSALAPCLGGRLGQQLPHRPGLLGRKQGSSPNPTQGHSPPESPSRLGG